MRNFILIIVGILLCITDALAAPPGSLEAGVQIRIRELKNDLQSQINTLNTHFSNLSSRNFSELKNLLNTLKQQVDSNIQGFDARIQNNLAPTQQRHAADVSAIHATERELKDQLETLQKQITTQQESLESKIAVGKMEFQAQVLLLKGNLEEFSKKIEDLIADLDSRVASNTSGITTLNRELKQQGNVLLQRVDTLNTQLGARVAQQSSDVGTYSLKISDLNKKIRALKNKKQKKPFQIWIPVTAGASGVVLFGSGLVLHEHEQEHRIREVNIP